MLARLQDLATLIGLATIAFFTYSLISFATFQLAPSATLQRYKRDNEKTYALITGSSGGIGFGYALELAHRGFGVVLLAHIKEELDAAEKRIKDACPTADVRLLHMNAMTASIADIKQAVDSLSNLRVTILINNVGGHPLEPPSFRLLSDYAPEDIDNCIDMNARFMARLSSIMLPTLKRNGPSLLLNVSSGGHIGLPYLPMYAATKSFNLALSRSLTRESKVSSSDVDCLCIVPGDVHSDGNRMGVAPGSPKALDYAKLAIGRIDVAVSRGMLDMSPFWLHAVLIQILEWLPERVKRGMVAESMQFKMQEWAKVQ